jgi:hypothetical protein
VVHLVVENYLIHSQLVEKAPIFAQSDGGQKGQEGRLISVCNGKKSTAQNPDGIIGLDFNELTNADFPLVEPYLCCHPGEVFEQLTCLNKAGMERYKSKWFPAMVKEFLLLFACLLAAILSEEGGKQLWETACMKGVCARPKLDKILKLKCFKQLKGLYPSAFAPSEETTNHSEDWSPIEGVSAANKSSYW